jgi:hypothetical protein
MQKLAYLLGDLFKDDRRPIENTSAGFLAHNLLLQALDDPKKVLALVKGQTQALAAQLTAIETRIGTGVAVQRGGRELTQAERDKATTVIRENESALRNRYVVKDAALRKRLYDLFYPDKLNPYNAASLKTLPGIIRTYLNLLDDERPNVPDDFYAETVADLTPFAAARETQTKQKQATQQAQQQRQELLPLLTQQLTANLHELCTFYRADKLQVLSYFDPRYFEVHASARPGHYAARVATRHTNQVLDVAEALTRYTQARISVQEDLELCFFRGDDGQTPVPPTALGVRKGQPVSVRLAELPGAGALLLVSNATAYVGHYVIDLS